MPAISLDHFVTPLDPGTAVKTDATDMARVLRSKLSPCDINLLGEALLDAAVPLGQGFSQSKDR